ncbi:oligosaccharide flippase family protein [Acaryochloris sp. CCMEE 5410]|uniref:oligosaccharide flippase family protein n=1 Tax=Acaryochloris sp. CCMEE 5410 TaxID=310037 RepID=UPI00191C14E4|nr:oligosaccharide flippase family protein [Acaryochloris sp. CCMEE 5410]
MDRNKGDPCIASIQPQSMASLKKLVIRGTLWTLIGYGGSQGLRFGGNLILTRLLYPELFGLMALTNIFIIGLQLFSDLGTGWSVVQNKRGDDPVFLNTAWTVDVIRGFILWFGCLVIAWPIATLYKHPELLWLIPIVGITTIFSGFESTAVAQLERNLDVQKQVVFELTTQAVGIIIMIVWAAIAPSIWALVMGGLASAGLKMVWSHFLFPGSSNQFAWDKAALKDLLNLGRWIFLNTALTFLAEQADRLMLGDLFSLRLLGIYGIAFTLSDMPYKVVMSISNKVIFPAISKSIDEPRDILFPKILKSRRPFLFASIFLVVVLAGFGDLLITTLYDTRYLDASWMLPILALGIWPRLLSQTNESYLFAIGKFQYTTCGNILRLSCTVMGIWIGFRYFGNAGAIMGVALNDFFYYLSVNYGLLREGLNGMMQDLLATFLLLGCLSLIIAVRLHFNLDLPIHSLFSQPA